MAQPQPGRSRSLRPPKALYRVLPGCFVPPPPPPLPSWMVMDQHVRVGAPPVGLDQEWGIIRCSTKRAYGCGEHGQKVLDGLSFYVRLVKPTFVTTSMYIHLSDEALVGVQEEFGESGGPPIKIDGNQLHAQGAVSTVNDDVVVLVVIFRFRLCQMRTYYLVYDAIDGSMVMVPAPPDPSIKMGCMPTPLAVPRDRSGDKAGYELMFMSQRLVPPSPGQGYNIYEDVVYRWTPGGARTGAPLANGGPWQVQKRRFPQGVDDFIVEAMFTMEDQVFFADLAQGIVYCNLPTADGTALDFHFIPLPDEAPPEARWAKVEPEDLGPLNWYRTVGSAGGSISFVCIDRSVDRPEDMRLMQFTLDLSKKKWLKNKELRAVEIWKFLRFHKRGLPETVPKCPLMMADGTLSLLLPNMRKREEDPSADYVFNFDVQKMRLGWYSCLDDCSYMTPIILSWDFFKAVDPPANLKPRRAIFM